MLLYWFNIEWVRPNTFFVHMYVLYIVFKYLIEFLPLGRVINCWPIRRPCSRMGTNQQPLNHTRLCFKNQLCTKSRNWGTVHTIPELTSTCVLLGAGCSFTKQVHVPARCSAPSQKVYHLCALERKYARASNYIADSPAKYPQLDTLPSILQ